MEKDKLRIAIVEDNAGDAVLIKEMLSFGDVELTHFKDIESALEDFEFSRYDIALVDLGLPGCVGSEAPMMIINENPTLPVIALTGSDDIRVIQKVLSVGAQDYLIKGKFDSDTLIRAIRYSIERKKVHDNLYAQKQFSENIINTAGAIIMVLDETGRISRINEFFREMTGFRTEEVKNKNFARSFVSQSYIDKTESALKSSLVDNPDRRFVNSILKKDGGSVTVEWHFSQMKNNDNSFLGLLCVGLDISERVEAEDQLKRSEELLKRTQSIANVGSWIFDRTTSELVWSDEVYKIFGIDKRRIKPDYEILANSITGDDRAVFEREFKAALNEGKPFDIIHSIKRKDGTQRTVHQKAEHEKDRKGNVLRTLGMIHDITDQKELEEQLRQSQKMEAIGLLAGGIAHDFNNLLMVILCNCDLMLAEMKKNDPHIDDIIEIKKSGQRAAELTKQLLAFSRKQVLQPQILDLNMIISDLEKMVRRLVGEKIDIVTKIRPNIDMVKADRGQVDQIIMNLVVNARDAMPKGGKIIIETMNVALDDNYIKKYSDIKPGNYVMLAVTDTGSGMSKETVDKIFEPFFTTKGIGKGTGLGLSTVYGIVRQSGGYIYCYSEPGKGTAFKIYLPVAEEGIISGIDKNNLNALESHGETIVVIDDEKEIREVIARMLVQEGFEVLVAEKYEDVLNYFEERKIDLLITDVIMPEMNGDEIGELILDKYPGTKMIFMSGYTESTIIDFSLLDKNKIYLQKPFSRQSLVQNVKEILNG
ncbi:MAG: response regulator [Candidatus Delongbacteria bacterium]|nr:response regulator [Candidatus Delongbacteria bacterium]